MSETTERVQVTYVGQRLQKGKTLFGYRGTDGEEFGFTKRLLGYESVGQILEVTYVPETRSVRTSGDDAPKTVGTTPADDPALLDWELQDRSARARKAQIDRDKRVAKEQADPLLDALRPVKERLDKMLPAHREAAVASILTFLLH